MKSKVILGLAGLSLLLAIWTVILFVRSFSHYDAVFYSNLERTHQLFTAPGALVFSTWNHLPGEGFKWDGATGRLGEVKLRLYRDGELKDFAAWDNPPGMTAGFWWNRGQHTHSGEEGGVTFTRYHTNLAFPIWLLTLLLLLPPIAWGLKLLQRYQRAKIGHCIYCDTPMPTPDRCPKCETEYDEWVL